MAIILQAVWRLGWVAIKDAASVVVVVAAAALSLAGLAPVAVLLVSGIAIAMVRGTREIGKRGVAAALPVAHTVAAGAAGTSVGLGSVFLVFLKFGAVVFGSGYVLLAFLRADLIARLHWLSENQLLDALAVGQVTPGPVFTTATFIGYLLAGWTGAAVATVGIFLPAFLLVAASSPFVPLLRESRLVAALLDGVNAGAVALMAVVTWQLGRAGVADGPAGVLAVASAVLLLRFRLNSTWLILAAAALGSVFGARVH